LTPSNATAAVPGPIALRAYYFCFLAAIGIAAPFYPTYLRGLGFSGKQVAWVFAAAPIMHMFGPIIWGWATDRTRRPDIMLRVALAGSMLAYLPLSLTKTFAVVMCIALCHQIFNVALPGLSDMLAVARVRGAGDDYGRIRVWGSFGFLVSCLVAGQVFTMRGRAADPLFPFMVAAMLGAALLISFKVKAQGGRERPTAHDALQLLRDKRFRMLLVIAGIHWACAVPYHGFFGLYVQDRGFDSRVISLAFATSVASEMLAFYVFKHLRRHARLSTFMLVVTAVSALRWVVTGFATNAIVLVLVQAGHGLTFGLFWATSLAWLMGCVPERVRATGQTLFTGAVYGLGSLFGSLLSGATYDATGSAAPLFFGAAALNGLLALFLLFRGRNLSPDV
jgi:MFS transporter, PPP family, 3-phenylpropionic acid transporter